MQTQHAPPHKLLGKFTEDGDIILKVHPTHPRYTELVQILAQQKAEEARRRPRGEE